jgi:hypothetical protein
VFWREYLLYHRSEGFAFLVDADDGWSWTVPITGVPESAGEGVKYRGVLYRKLYDYTGKVTYVLGEFYWKLEREQRTFNTDYRGTGQFTNRQLNRERTGSGGTEGGEEIVWSAGESMTSDAVLKAFRLAPEKSAALRRDVAPISGNFAGLLAKATTANHCAAATARRRPNIATAWRTSAAHEPVAVRTAATPAAGATNECDQRCGEACGYLVQTLLRWRHT